MKKYDVIFTDSFCGDLREIVSYIRSQTKEKDVARDFYEKVFLAIEKRSYYPQFFERYYVSGNPHTFYRLYFGKYTIYYTLHENVMEVQRMLWGGNPQ